jgi:hypothetical protein
VTEYPIPVTTWHYLGEDTKRAVMFDSRRREAERLERAAKYAQAATNRMVMR